MEQCMRQFFKSLVILGAAAFMFWGCATIIHGTSQQIGVSSSPSGAKVWVDDQEKGTTPLFVKLKRSKEHIIRIQLDGYQKAELTVTKGVSGWVWGNIVIGGIIGLAIDAASGGLYELDPSQLNAELRKDGSSAMVKDGEMYVVTVLRPNPSWKKIGALTSTK